MAAGLLIFDQAECLVRGDSSGPAQALQFNQEGAADHVGAGLVDETTARHDRPANVVGSDVESDVNSTRRSCGVSFDIQRHSYIVRAGGDPYVFLYNLVNLENRQHWWVNNTGGSNEDIFGTPRQIRFGVSVEY